ncbi:hypothetical protein PINS_up012123 [Pythium insidiosum]|nr:hypothetical protein PINS_up012123 [Pythium insidiosum]
MTAWKRAESPNNSLSATRAPSRPTTRLRRALSLKQVWHHAVLPARHHKVFSYQSSEDGSFASLLEYVELCLRWLLLEPRQSSDDVNDDNDAKSKVTQRVGHLLLDSLESFDLSHSNSTSPANRGADAGMTRLFLAVADQRELWLYLNLTLRAVDVCSALQERHLGSINPIPCTDRQTVRDVLYCLLDANVPRWTAVAIEVVRVFKSLLSLAQDECSEILQRLIIRHDWQNAEVFVSTLKDMHLLRTLYRELTARNMTKALKRLRKCATRLQPALNALPSLDNGFSACQDHVQHMLGPPLDIEGSRLRVLDELPPFNWRLIDTVEQIEALTRKLAKLRASNKVCIIGLDCEWRPNGLLSTAVDVSDDSEELPAEDLNESHDGVSLYQLAVADEVFVVDVQTLGDAAQHPLELIWSEPDVFVLVGFCVSGDLRRLHRSFPELFSTRASVSRQLVELKQLAYFRRLPASKWGLAQLYDVCLGEQLDKEEQCSDWSRRPLTSSQIVYAAKDAFVVRNITEFLLCDLDTTSTREDPAFLRRFAVVTSIERGGDLHDAFARELGHWINSFEPMSTEHVRAALQSYGLQDVADRIFTVSDEHQDTTTGCDFGRIVKTIAIVFRNGAKDVAGGETRVNYAAVVLPLNASIDMHRLSREFRIASDDIMLADRETLIRVFGYRRGGVGPIGLREQPAIRVVVDASLMSEYAILCGAGQEDVVYPIAPMVLCQTVAAHVAAISDADVEPECGSTENARSNQ